MSGRETALDRTILDACLKIKGMLEATKPIPSPSPPQGSGVKLPKIDVPTFDGKMLNWTTFWEQFKVSIHSKD